MVMAPPLPCFRPAREPYARQPSGARATQDGTELRKPTQLGSLARRCCVGLAAHEPIPPCAMRADKRWPLDAAHGRAGKVSQAALSGPGAPASGSRPRWLVVSSVGVAQ